LTFDVNADIQEVDDD